MKRILIAFTFVLSLTSCKKDKPDTVQFNETKITLSTHQLATFSVINNSRYLVVFESGLGDDHLVWNQKNVAGEISASADVVLYDRGGYGKSQNAPGPRDIAHLSNELETVISKYANNRKVILVGHSLGGMIIRDYALKHPTAVAGLLFVDPSHEAYNHPTQTQEDQLYKAFADASGPLSGAAMEARELIEDAVYLGTTAALPDVPVTVLTAMKTDADHDVADRQKWYNAHELLKAGLSNFTHLSTARSGHYLMIEEEGLVISSLKNLMKKLP